MHGKKPQSTEQLKFSFFKAPSYPQIECFQLIKRNLKFMLYGPFYEYNKIHNEKYVQRVS